MNNRFLLTLPTFFLVLISACSSSESPLGTENIFSTETTEVNYEVDYMEGAEPYVGTTLTGQPIWNFLMNNISALLDNTKTVTVPVELTEMEQIPAEAQNYSADDILAMADQYRNQPSLENGVATIYVIFVDGFYIEDGEVNNAVLGVSLGDTGVVAMFKPVIDGAAALPAVKKFVEQSVLIHESGHALGLVNNGLELTSAHHDSEHGAHCTNQDCVMYYLNEGVADLIGFIQSGNVSTESVIFGDECLADAAAAL